MINQLWNRVYNPHLGLLFIRIALGVVFIHAGWFKVTNMGMIVTDFASIGIPAWLAYIAAYTEFLGGILVLVGLFERYAAVLISVVMLVAMFKVHLPNGFSIATGGIEYVFVLLFMALAIVTSGAGKYALSRVMTGSVN
jgi:putative oxidoreductase